MSILRETAQPRCLLRLRLLHLHPSGQLLASPPLPLYPSPRRRCMICDPFPSITMFSSCHSISPLKPVFSAASSARLASSLHTCSLLSASSGPSAEPAVRTESSHPRVYIFQGVKRLPLPFPPNCYHNKNISPSAVPSKHHPSLPPYPSHEGQQDHLGQVGLRLPAPEVVTSCLTSSRHRDPSDESSLCRVHR